MVQPFASLPEHLLAPLQGRGDDAWFAAPPGRWSPAEIVDHLATAMEQSAKGFNARVDKPPMTRRPASAYEHVAKFAILGIGWFGPRRVAPSTTLPGTRPERAATETKLRAAVAAWLDLERRLLPQRAHDLFLKHPRMGDLTLPEWMIFHARHAEHHRLQILDRLEATGSR